MLISKRNKKTREKEIIQQIQFKKFEKDENIVKRNFGRGKKKITVCHNIFLILLNQYSINLKKKKKKILLCALSILVTAVIRRSAL